SPKLPNTISGRLLVAIWWLGIIVLMNAFSGHMKASMMVKADFDRIDSLKDLALKSKIIPLVWKGTAYESYLEKSTSPDIKQIWKRLYEHNGLLLPSELYRQDNLEALQKGTNVIISDVITMRYIVSNECSKLPEGEFYFAKETFFPHTFVMAMRKKLPKRIQNDINKRIRWMVEAGMVDKWLDKMNGDLERCLDQDGGDRARALGVEDLWAIFILWAICIAMATAAFVFELLFYKLRTISKKQTLMNLKAQR
ncbi:ionotropic receptor 93a-like, partial [Limulus polyphemus]|uniref:Ionotropic receptor 93a-like n=1 Tax=Limulus polyphemus TaxID=6850 RepID=A0ABM1B2D3_LIMPO